VVPCFSCCLHWICLRDCTGSCRRLKFLCRCLYYHVCVGFFETHIISRLISKDGGNTPFSCHDALGPRALGSHSWVRSVLGAEFLRRCAYHHVYPGFQTRRISPPISEDGGSTTLSCDDALGPRALCSGSLVRSLDEAEFLRRCPYHHVYIGFETRRISRLMLEDGVGMTFSCCNAGVHVLYSDSWGLSL